jgi:hypothetical protein
VVLILQFLNSVTSLSIGLFLRSQKLEYSTFEVIILWIRIRLDCLWWSLIVISLLEISLLHLWILHILKD